MSDALYLYYYIELCQQVNLEMVVAVYIYSYTFVVLFWHHGMHTQTSGLFICKKFFLNPVAIMVSKKVEERGVGGGVTNLSISFFIIYTFPFSADKNSI